MIYRPESFPVFNGASFTLKSDNDSNARLIPRSHALLGPHRGRGECFAQHPDYRVLACLGIRISASVYMQLVFHKSYAPPLFSFCRCIAADPPWQGPRAKRSHGGLIRRIRDCRIAYFALVRTPRFDNRIHTVCTVSAIKASL